MWYILGIQITLHVAVLLLQLYLFSKIKGNYVGLSGFDAIKAEGDRVMKAIDKVGQRCFLAQAGVWFVFTIIYYFFK